MNIVSWTDVLDDPDEFEALLVCAVGTLDFTAHQALPKATDTKVVKKWLCFVNKCLYYCFHNQRIPFPSVTV